MKLNLWSPFRKKYQKHIVEEKVLNSNSYDLCGYVTIPKKHKFYKVHHEELPQLNLDYNIDRSGFTDDGYVLGFRYIENCNFRNKSNEHKRWIFENLEQELDKFVAELKKYEK